MHALARTLTRSIGHALALVVLVLVGCAEPRPQPASGAAPPGRARSVKKRPKKPAKPVQIERVQHGFATWYGGGHHGGPTASGERYNKRAMTAAHRTLPMNTRVRVTNKKNNRSVVLRINDRGPYGKKRERIIDVSEAAAERLNMIKAGVVPVVVEVLE